MNVLGIDPALVSLGWGIISKENNKIRYIASGTIRAEVKNSLPLRLAYINNSIAAIVNEHKPKVVAMEETFVNNNPISSMKLGFVRGAVMALIGSYNLPFYEYKPNSIKKTLAGAGHAEKEQIRHMLRVMIIDVPFIDNLDEIDALATAYTCLVYEKL